MQRRQQATHNSLQGFFSLPLPFPEIWMFFQIFSKFEEGSHLTRRSKFCAKKDVLGSLLFGLQKVLEVLFPKTDKQIGPMIWRCLDKHKDQTHFSAKLKVKQLQKLNLNTKTNRKLVKFFVSCQDLSQRNSFIFRLMTILYVTVTIQCHRLYLCHCFGVKLW